MKKNSILKAIAIMFLIYVVLSWIIPGGSFAETTFTKDTTYPLGLGDIITYPIATFFSSNFAGVPFIMTAIIILFIGGLYGVMNKTGVYTRLVDKTVSIFKDKPKFFVVISILVFGILASLTTLSLPLFILVPFMMTIILMLGYDKITALLSTVGAILVGNMAVTYGYNTESLSYFNILFSNGINDLIVVRIVLLVVSILVLNIFILYYSKKSKKHVETSKKSKKNAENEEVDTLKLYDKDAKTKRGALPLFIILCLIVIISLVGMYAWEGALNIKLFSDIHENIINFKINNYAIFANLLGTSNKYLGWTIGTWGNYDLIVILLITSVVIGLIYKLSFKEIFDGFKSGMKEMTNVALIAILANVIYLVAVVAYNAGESLFISSIINRIIGLASGMNYFAIALITAVAAPLFNELPYLVATLQQPLMSAYENYPLLTIIMQAVYGLMMMILPTSVILVAGMTYADISIKEYFKGSWKLLVGLFIAITVAILLFMYCPGIKVL